MKRVFLLLSILLILIAIPVTVFLVAQQQELRKKAAPATTLSIVPSALTKKTGEVFSLDIAIDTGDNQVVAAELHVVFDPTKLEAQTITNSSLFPNILTAGVVERGSVAITVGAADVKKPVKGTGTVAVARFKTLEKTETPTSIRLAPNTFVGGLGEGATNVLIGTIPATITITDVGTTSTTTIATSSATTVMTKTPLPTPLITSSPTATAPATLTISSPASGSTMTTTTPTIRGKSSPGAIITITIYSTPQTVTVKADANGNWSYTPSSSLTNGLHNVVVSAPGPSGSTQTATTQFMIAGGSSPPASQSATIAPTAAPIPQSGTMSLTLVSLSLGLLFFLIGAAVSIVWIR